MPELPEVETIVRGLQAVLPGKRIMGVRLGKTDFIEDPAALEEHLPGRLISSVRRYGKFLVFDLESPDGDSPRLALLIHLGMTGQIVACKPEAPIATHTHAYFAFDDGSEMRYRDIRRFGSIRILAEGPPTGVLGPLGLDPLEATEGEFRARIKGRAARIKALLLDQRVLRGMGNIYTDESLWHARIHPMQLGVKLQGKELHSLYVAMRRVLTQAIRFRGSSISDYVDSEGVAGKFQQRHRVYGREGQKCPRCGAVIRRTKVAGRSSYFCPNCQRAPRKTRKRRSNRGPGGKKENESRRNQQDGSEQLSEKK
ncbi:MAG: bifunctional DNA-formamidopyrimidine glycosylase/DNA-(apurinic or apyrimidinic site) lyase [Candidatus Acidiferrales bacterium]